MTRLQGAGRVCAPYHMHDIIERMHVLSVTPWIYGRDVELDPHCARPDVGGGPVTHALVRAGIIATPPEYRGYI